MKRVVGSAVDPETESTDLGFLRARAQSLPPDAPQLDRLCRVVADLGRWAALQPAAVALTWLPDGGPPETFTYGALAAAVATQSAHLAASGASRVALLAGTDPHTVVAMLGALAAGVPCLLLNPGDPRARLEDILATHPCDLVLRSPYVGDHVRDIATALPGVGEGHLSADAFERHGALDEPALLFGTSGSTAASKVVVQSERCVSANAAAMRLVHSLGPGTRIMGGLPLHHVNGVHLTVMAPVHAGAEVVLPQSLSVLGHGRLLENYPVDLASVVPPVLEGMTVTAGRWRPPARLRYVVTAAAPLSASLARRFIDRVGVRLVQGYGLTETTNFATTVPVDLDEADHRAILLDLDPPSVGVAVPGNVVAVLDEADQPVDAGIVGEVCVRGLNVMEGYAGRPDLTLKSFAGGWFHTGDLGCWRSGPGGARFIFLTGRLKNVAKVSGDAVSLEEVDRAALAVPGVVDAACVAQDDSLTGERLTLFVQLDGSTTTGDVLDHIRRRIPPAAVPVQCRSVERIARTPTGKLRRADLIGTNPP